VDGSGVMIPPVEEITVQKYDMQFGTNVMGTFALFG
jgi:retinol dehydrogenase-12